MKILIFGGTGEARELANRLVALGHDVTTSLAGRTQSPLLPHGAVRSGGFGGVRPLSAFITSNGFERIIDATHPYAEAMSGQLVIAAKLSGVALIRLQRPVWAKPDEAEWIVVRDAGAAMAQLPHDAVPFISLGHKEMAGIDFTLFKTCLVRFIEAPIAPLPKNVELVLARPPYDLEGEVALMRAHRITHLISKNAGGVQTRAKIDAAAMLGLPVLIISRPSLPTALEAISVDAVLTLLQEATP